MAWRQRTLPNDRIVKLEMIYVSGGGERQLAYIAYLENEKGEKLTSTSTAYFNLCSAECRFLELVKKGLEACK